MTHLVVYVGAQRTGSEAVHRGLFLNEDELAKQGVLVPVTGRHELSPNAIRHHQLPWSLDPADDHPLDDRLWELLAEEIEEAASPTAVLASGLFSRLAADPAQSAEVVRRLRGLADDLTLVLFVRDQLALLNDLYCYGVRSLELSSTFDTYLEQSGALERYDFAATFAPWYEDGSVRFVSVPWDPDGGDDALAALLSAGGVALDPDALSAVEDVPDELVGPVAIEATRLLSAGLRGRFPDFRPSEPAARRLRRRAVVSVRARGWSRREFWGWAPQQAADAVARYAESNQEFARRTGSADWTLPSQQDRPQRAAELVELNLGVVNRVLRFVDSMETAFERLREREAAA